ncbi:MAG TPA: hypothetical protein VIX20_12655 [Ktedonobacteraceae bacterium]|jgi:hypothetical protein
MAQQQEVTFPYIQIAVGMDGIVLETFYSPQISMKMLLREEQVNEIMKAWVANRKELQKQQQLAQKVKRELH